MQNDKLVLISSDSLDLHGKITGALTIAKELSGLNGPPESLTAAEIEAILFHASGNTSGKEVPNHIQAQVKKDEQEKQARKEVAETTYQEIEQAIIDYYL